MVKDLVFGKVCSESLVNTTLAGSATGNAIDGQGYFATKHILMTGAITVDVVVKLQESDSSGSGYTDVAAADLVGADSGVNTVTFDAATEDNTCKQLGYLGGKRYTRISVTAGTGDLVAIAEQCANLAS